jgi:hypothetical protein
MGNRKFAGAANHARSYTTSIHWELVKRLTPQRFGDLVDNLITSANSGNTKAAELVLKLSGVMDFDPDGLRTHLERVTQAPLLHGVSPVETDEILEDLYPSKTAKKAKDSRRV